ncbi:phosphopantetheine-binding protein [Myxococcota bacterium]|nr:phosphopantetheine-binding protein [Myxococcota bacterium]
MNRTLSLAAGLAVLSVAAAPAAPAQARDQVTRASGLHSKDELRTQVREHLDRIEGVDISRVKDDDDIVALGGNSLEVAEQLTAAAKALGITIPRDKVQLRDVPTITQVVDKLDQAQRGQL